MDQPYLELLEKRNCFESETYLKLEETFQKKGKKRSVSLSVSPRMGSEEENVSGSEVMIDLTSKSYIPVDIDQNISGSDSTPDTDNPFDFVEVVDETYST